MTSPRMSSGPSVAEQPTTGFRSMAQAMADGLARKARLGLSDDDMVREMLDRNAAKPG